MKVLHAGIFKDHELGGDIIFEKGLKQNGCDVERFDYRSVALEYGTKYMLQQLVEKIDNKDILFIGKGEQFNPQTLRTVRNRGVEVVLWYGDMLPEPAPWLINLLPEVDFFFMSSGGDALREYFVKGSPRMAAYYFNPSDPELSDKYSSIPRCTRDVVFTGTSHGLVGTERLQTVNYLKTRTDVTFFGGAERTTDNSRNRIIRFLGRYFKSKSDWVRGQEYIAAIKSASIGVGVNAFQNIPRYTSDRLSHYLTFGTFYLPWRFPGIEELFEVGKEIVSFTGIEDLDSKLTYYLNEQGEREAIAAAGQQKMLHQYNCKNIVGMMLDIVKTGTSDRFSWVEILS